MYFHNEFDCSFACFIGYFGGSNRCSFYLRLDCGWWKSPNRTLGPTELSSTTCVLTTPLASFSVFWWCLSAKCWQPGSVSLSGCLITFQNLSLFFWAQRFTTEVNHSFPSISYAIFQGKTHYYSVFQYFPIISHFWLPASLSSTDFLSFLLWAHWWGFLFSATLAWWLNQHTLHYILRSVFHFLAFLVLLLLIIFPSTYSLFSPILRSSFYTSSIVHRFFFQRL